MVEAGARALLKVLSTVVIMAPNLLNENALRLLCPVA